NGALLLNYAQVNSFIKDAEGKIEGAWVQDNINKDKLFCVRSKIVVNAAGPWVDTLRKEDSSLQGKRLQLTKGVHIVIPYSKLPVRQAVYFDAPDGRMIFAIPRNGITYVGTTDTVYNDDIDYPTTTREDVEYLINAINNMFNGIRLSQNDVVSSWAGLRPLIHEDGKAPSELSRKDEIIESPSGLISIAGGKLTGFRLMAEKIVDLVVKKIRHKEDRTFRKCVTKKFPLRGSNFSNSNEAEKYKQQLLLQFKPLFGEEYVVTIFHRFGSESVRILEEAVSFLKEFDPLEALIFSQLDYCIRNESIYSVADFLVRRTGDLYFNRPATLPLLEKITDYISQKLKLLPHQKDEMLHEISRIYQQAVDFSKQ
ncbi:MAG: FAD-dependent oxidoreductase, partial [Chitinophagales bacterium]|nr:FAD-dependent oxidoreductase [Chitinophagales bacterium]